MTKTNTAKTARQEWRRKTVTEVIGDALSGFYYAEGFDAVPDAHDVVMSVLYSSPEGAEAALEGFSFEACEKIAQAAIDAKPVQGES
jgi:Tfp pilus assembly protein PilV